MISEVRSEVRSKVRNEEKEKQELAVFPFPISIHLLFTLYSPPPSPSTFDIPCSIFDIQKEVPM
jgi:hypothetical protein